MQIKNIKFNWKIAFIIGFIITFISGCEVQAVENANDIISIESSYEYRSQTLDFYNQLLNEYFNTNDIDLSTFTNYSTFSDYLFNRPTYTQIFLACNDGTVGAVFRNTSIDFNIYQNRYYINSGTRYKIDVENKTITSASGLMYQTLIFNNTLKSDFIADGYTEEEYLSIDYMKYLLSKYCLFYNGKILNPDGLIANSQVKNKVNYYKYIEDDTEYYFSGDISLYDNYFKIKDFETNVSDYNMYLLRYTVSKNLFGDFKVFSHIESKEISKPNQGGESSWEISNLFDEISGDRIYAIGIGTEDSPFLLTSEWFDADNNISNFMNSTYFRLNYYVEELPNFFLSKEEQGNGNLGQITNPSGDVTGSIDLGDIVGPRNINSRRFDTRTNNRKYGL